MQIRDLFEGRDAPLYHYMDYEKSMDVIERDEMHAYWKHTIPGIGDVKGNSFSRNARFGYPGRPVKIMVDQAKLAETNRIIPLDGELIFRGWGGIGQPRAGHADRRMNSRPGHAQLAEEFVIGDIKRLHRCITGIELQNPNVYHMSGQEILNLDQMVRVYAGKWGIPLTVHPNYEAKIEEIRERWKEYEQENELEEAAPDENMRQQTFYHGVDNTEAAKFVMKNGLKGRDVQGRAHMAPVAGRSYLAQNLPYAIIYALGGDIAGHKVAPRPGKDPYGYLFVLKGDGIEDVQPDEDSVGEFLYDHTEKGRFKGDPSGLAYVAWKWIWDSVTPNQRRAILDGEYSAWAHGGKRALKNMPDTIKMFLIRNGAHVAATGVLKPVEVWKIAKSKSHLLKRDGSNFFEIAKRVK
jgi:hypothetical protein